MMLQSRVVAWHKGGTQQKDGFIAGLRKHVSRRAVPSCDRNTLRRVCYFFQWLYWRTRGPEADAFLDITNIGSSNLFLLF